MLDIKHNTIGIMHEQKHHTLGTNTKRLFVRIYSVCSKMDGLPYFITSIRI